MFQWPGLSRCMRLRQYIFPAMLLLLSASPTLLPTPGAAQTLPPGFVADDLTPGQSFMIPVGMTRTPDGRILVAEKLGRLMVYQNGVMLSTPMWDGRTEILSNGDRGLVGLAVDPNYAVNRYVYLAYVVDPDSNGVDDDWVSYSRLTRFQTSLADPNVIDTSTRTVLIGKSWADGIPSGDNSHTIDCLRFAPDGSLLVSAGDGASYNEVDAGGLHGPIFYPGRVDPLQDIGSFRSQYLGTLGGKVLRINPANGNGYVSNPYYDGQMNSHASRVWSYGLRNPFRFTIRPGTGVADTALANPGVLYISDTGWSTWEELNVARTPGQNFGWPCYEGPFPHPGYQAASPAHNDCSTIGTPVNPATASGPVLSWHHFDAGLSLPPGYRGNSSTGNCFYSGTLYPAAYQGAVFFADMASDWLKVATVNATDQLVQLSDFGEDMGGVVDLMRDPFTGDLLYISIQTGQIRRIRYTSASTGNQTPTAVAGATSMVGVAPAAITFSSVGSADAEGGPLGFGWVFGDGESVVGASPTHLFTTPGVYDVVLSASDPQGAVGRDTVQVIINATAAFPVTPIVDTFDRADGPVGSGWSGQTGNFAVYSNTLRQAASGGQIRWNGASSAASQEAFFTLYSVDPAADYELLLKLQGTTTTDAGVRVRYDAGAASVAISSFVDGQGEQAAGTPIAVSYQPGDQFGARAYQNGAIELFRNGQLVGARNVAAWTWATSAGGLGLGMTGGVPVQLDDFGGGTVIFNSNTPPTAAILAPADSSFFVAADSVQLSASYSDAEDPPNNLAADWTVDLIHNNHTHPSIFQASTAVAHFLAEDHDDGTGVHYAINLKVQDTGGLAVSRRVDIFPEVDLEPSLPTVTPANPTQLDSLHWTFKIHNRGRMPAPTSHWQLASDGAPFAEGDVQVAPLDSVTLVRHLPPTLAAGDHTITLTVDALTSVHETDEANNVSTAPLHLDEGVSGLPDAGPVGRLSLSDAFPNPAGAEVFWLLTLPARASVELRVFDVQGREVWSGASREYDAGRWRLLWPGRTTDGGSAPSGIYMARIVASDGLSAPRSWTQRITRLR